MGTQASASQNEVRAECLQSPCVPVMPMCSCRAMKPGSPPPPPPQVLSEVHEHLGVAVLNRPRALNALNTGMVEALTELYRRWDADPAVACILLKARALLRLARCVREARQRHARAAQAAGRVRTSLLPTDFLPIATPCRRAQARRPSAPAATSRRWCSRGRRGGLMTH